jgi:hypothetical protein
MTDKFIFIFLDDCTLDVVSPTENLVGTYEGIDVEKGLYAFFDQNLHKMEAKFIVANRKRKLLGLPCVISGEYELISGKSDRNEFLKRLSEVVHVNSNEWFESKDDIHLYIKELKV